MSTDQPLVSVVIPCYNYGRFLGEAIESVLNQTHQPIEVIVVDDGSTDDSKAVAGQYPVTLISLPNSGVCAAANAGFAAAQGEFLLRLDADDCLAPNCIEQTLAALFAHPDAAYAYTQCRYFGTKSGTYPIEAYDPETLAERNYVHASALMRRHALRLVGGYNPNMVGTRLEDWDLWLTFAELGMGGVMVAEPLLHYRQHPTPSRGTMQVASWRAIRRELLQIARLQDNHPRLMAVPRLLRRLGTLPRRLRAGHMSLRTARLLVPFYAIMLVRAGLKRTPRARRAANWLDSCKSPSMGGTST